MGRWTVLFRQLPYSYILDGHLYMYWHRDVTSPILSAGYRLVAARTKHEEELPGLGFQSWSQSMDPCLPHRKWLSLFACKLHPYTVLGCD